MKHEVKLRLKRNMKKGWRIFFGLACAALLCTACGAKEPPKEEQVVDYSGKYTDKQGTSEVYSELSLSRNEDGAYAVMLSIYRVTTLEGTAAEQSGILHFVSDVSSGPAVEGDIAISGEDAEITFTASDFPEIAVGDICRFPDGE